ncbi:IS66 C-terminal element [Pseudobutyrivibrio sp. ACV-2]|uniref:transposase domain-containing protein n=1 Tax=Pseudobutyrivibrio sp. ACV-2 TaxID=1520801 RepID=UPI0008995FA0|nr:IS66 C-terminal element [Pseudobutyrivibrio sp. ACV-2]
MKIYSLVESVKANGIDPLKYLTYLLDNRPSADMSDDDFERLAPWSNETRKACEL